MRVLIDTNILISSVLGVNVNEKVSHMLTKF